MPNIPIADAHRKVCDPPRRRSRDDKMNAPCNDLDAVDLSARDGAGRLIDKVKFVEREARTPSLGMTRSPPTDSVGEEAR